MDKVVIIHLLGVYDVAVLLLAQVFRVDAVGPQELLVGHTEGLPNRLGYQLGLWEGRKVDPSMDMRDLLGAHKPSKESSFGLKRLRGRLRE